MAKVPQINARFVLAGLFTALLTALFGSGAILGALLHFPERWSDGCSRLWARWILWAADMQVEIQGLENLPQESVVLVGNHQGVFDILALLAYLPRPPVFVAKHTLFRVPIFGQALTAQGHIPVNRSNHEKAIASIKKGTETLLKRGRQVVFFPEGTRTRDGQMKPFKKGAFVFAIESGLPLVPFAIEGSYHALPPERKVIQPGTIRICFLPPIPSQNYTFETRNELLEQSRQHIFDTLQELQAPTATQSISLNQC